MYDSGSPSGRWKADLESWAIPESVLEQADESPYGWPPELWRRRTRESRTRRGTTPTTSLVTEMLGVDGTLVDVGAGTGRSCLPYARAGHRVTAVEKNPGMAAGLREEADAEGLEVEVLVGAWPDAAVSTPVADVALSSHVVYDVADIGPFIRALGGHCRRGAVVEMTNVHPWTNMNYLYRAIHDLDRPEGPSVEDLVAVIVSELGVEVGVVRWERAPDLWFRTWDDVLAYYGRRVAVPLARRAELRPLLKEHVVARDDRLYVEDGPRTLATLWWSPDH
ncbi:MAG: class I SAM-dependent methyltransferase [Acidimicrobiia bacterium]|nr:class I SAM-dependent methyltransferase [Acidimicrobiia bacterium]MXY74577.1 class I SAM-dependent methyltransferase [Acidimicrobiia bacterium]